MLLKYRYLLLLPLLLYIQNSKAQSNTKKPSPEEIIEQRMPSIRETLKLDDLQASFVKTTLVKYLNEKMELINTSERSDILKAKMVEVEGRQDGELLRLLNEDQLSKLKEILKEQYPDKQKKEKGRGKGKGQRKKNKRF